MTTAAKPSHTVSIHRGIRWADMKLEVDLVRQLLLHIEEHATRPISDLDSIKIDGWTEDQIGYHVVQLKDAGFIEASISSVPDNENPDLVHVIYSVRRLTYKGHEFVETVRDDTIWRKVKKKGKAIGAMTLPALVNIGAGIIKSQIGL
ncbi:MULTISPECIES: DUF2513 domain-containing protein [Bradyrhizobium]|uniref:DUF2513 domain-containing protein n=1 Tax=Bradyrhizobium arachidis TaxID=858423 RepID=A0AAE7NK41_9BRAD|nr:MULTISPECIES: DUF2513 domain-containing protein [Bradyrhizobium]QOZ66816.1 DUF2513 domain-containing protein [Bradyrhizobium arachidis]SFV19397.1 Hypothetical protein SAMN05192541_15014 [Bradyrhizobium arachidis]